MPRYIDADALRKQISETYEYEFPTASGGFDEFATKIIPNIINNAPTADAVPVVRGEWIHGCHDGAGTEFCYCSECYEDALKDKGGYTEFSRYCPNCGAKMDGEKEGV
jgi:hypothetical protein